MDHVCVPEGKNFAVVEKELEEQLTAAVIDCLAAGGRYRIDIDRQPIVIAQDQRESVLVEFELGHQFLAEHRARHPRVRLLKQEPDIRLRVYVNLALSVGGEAFPDVLRRQLADGFHVLPDGGEDNVALVSFAVPCKKAVAAFSHKVDAGNCLVCKSVKYAQSITPYAIRSRYSSCLSRNTVYASSSAAVPSMRRVGLLVLCG